MSFRLFVAEPEEVEADLVAGDELVVGVPLEALGLLALVAVLGAVAGHEVVEIGSGERVLLEGEVLLGTQVVDPQLLGPGLLGALAAAEEQHVGLHTLGVEDAGGQAQQRVDLPVMQEPAADRLARSSFEEHVVGHHDRRPSAHLEQADYVLYEIELLVAGCGPEIVALVAVRRRPAEGRVGEHHIEALAGAGAQRVVHMDRRVGLGALDAMQQQVHGAQSRREVGDFRAGEGARAQVGCLVGLQGREPVDDGSVRAQEEAAGAAGRIADAVAGLGHHHVDDRGDQCPRREVLASASGALLGGLLDQSLVGGACDVGVVAEPLVLVDEVLDKSWPPTGNWQTSKPASGSSKTSCA